VVFARLLVVYFQGIAIVATVSGCECIKSGQQGVLSGFLAVTYCLKLKKPLRYSNP